MRGPDQRKGRLAAAIERMRRAARTPGAPEQVTLCHLHPEGLTGALHDRIVDAGLHETGFRPFHRLHEVERLSREGKSVADIAATLRISYRHVVELRARAGVGRKR